MGFDLLEVIGSSLSLPIIQVSWSLILPLQSREPGATALLTRIGMFLSSNCDLEKNEISNCVQHCYELGWRYDFKMHLAFNLSERCDLVGSQYQHTTTVLPFISISYPVCVTLHVYIQAHGHARAILMIYLSNTYKRSSVDCAFIWIQDYTYFIIDRPGVCDLSASVSKLNYCFVESHKIIISW